MQADFQPRVAERTNNTFRHLFGLLRINFISWTLPATVANCSCYYRIHLMMVVHCFTPPVARVSRNEARPCFGFEVPSPEIALKKVSAYLLIVAVVAILIR